MFCVFCFCFCFFCNSSLNGQRHPQIQRWSVSFHRLVLPTLEFSCKSNTTEGGLLYLILLMQHWNVPCCMYQRTSLLILIPLYDYTTACLSTHPLMDVSIASTLRLLWIEVLWNFLHIFYKHVFLFFHHIYRNGIAGSYAKCMFGFKKLLNSFSKFFSSNDPSIIWEYQLLYVLACVLSHVQHVLLSIFSFTFMSTLTLCIVFVYINIVYMFGVDLCLSGYPII